jgi:hypothetical protein
VKVTIDLPDGFDRSAKIYLMAPGEKLSLYEKTLWDIVVDQKGFVYRNRFIPDEIGVIEVCNKAQKKKWGLYGEDRDYSWGPPDGRG